MAYHRFHGVQTRIVRIFNTYGERMRVNDGRVVPAFISQALRNEPLTVFGDGSQTRSFCYYSDLIEGIHLDRDRRPLTALVVGVDGLAYRLEVLRLRAHRSAGVPSTFA